MLQAAICDNEELFTQKMKTLLADCLKGYELDAQIETFVSAQAFLQACQTKRYDFVFLDVELDEASGMDVACEMRKTNPDAILVFASGFVKYAVQGYKVRAFRYLLKQELEEEFPICMKEVLQEIKRQRQTMSIKTVDGAAVSVRLSDIWYLEGKNHNVCVCTAGWGLSGSRHIKPSVRTNSVRGFYAHSAQLLCQYAQCRSGEGQYRAACK